jgi:MerR family mercuric resistance operon transcriptional regulator
LQRLCLVQAAFEAGIGLDALVRLCRALDAMDGGEAVTSLAMLRQFVERRCGALASLEAQLAASPTEPAQHAENLP